LTADQRQQIEVENVADCPEIELRILTQAPLPPVLAEVAFPPSMSVAEAKQYIFRELQELPVQTTGQAITWVEHPDRIVVQFTEVPAAGAVVVELEAGVRELLARSSEEANGTTGRHAPPHTCLLEFDRGAGWDLARAAEWLQRHLGVRDLGRTSWLDVPYRAGARLAAFLTGVLAPHPYRSGRLAWVGSAGLNGDGAASAVEFVPVPAASATEMGGHSTGTRSENGHRVAAPVRPRLPRGGAGLELDLADLRSRERVPAALRPALPPHGVINLDEAQAIVRLLETLTAAGSPDGIRQPIAVTALFPAQVALLRAIIGQSATCRRVPVTIAEPDALRQREFATVIVGLTRSHSHRAVSYGPDPQHLILALTRARSRLILVGDPGTLARRGQWDAALDHLDEPTAVRERDLLRQLARCLPADPEDARTRRREGQCP
jgi:hypothetical protein